MKTQSFIPSNQKMIVSISYKSQKDLASGASKMNQNTSGGAPVFSLNNM